jgi:hypothetical protein
MIDRRGLDDRLALARSGFSPPAGAKARVREGLSSPHAAGRQWLVRPGALVAPAILLLGLGVALGYGLGQRSAERRPEAALARGGLDASNDGSEEPLPERAGTPPSPPRAPGPAAPQPPVSAQPPLGAVEHETRPAARATRRPAPAENPAARTPRAPAADVASRARLDELDLLRRAERAIRAREVSLALSFLDELDRRHPGSSLMEERTAARVLAECTRSPLDARARAERFLALHAGSVYTDRIGRACALGVSGDGAEGSPARGH